MLKKIFMILSAICLCSCDLTETNKSYIQNGTSVKYYRCDVSGHVYTIEIEGHIYIVSASSSGGIIHAEHCPCKNH